MKSTHKKITWHTYAALGGLTAIILLVLVVPYSGLFQANLQQTTQLHGSSACQKLDVVTLPQNPIPANTSAVIALETTPQDFAGTFTYEASSGNLNDEQGNAGSYIESSSKKVDYSGGDDGTSITIQAKGQGNEQCLVTIPVIKTSTVACASLKIISNPSPLPPDQSAAFTVIPAPDNFQGTYLFQADSGSFQMQGADTAANGNNTKTLVTKSTNVLYNGGKSGEKIVVKALGTNNNSCIATLSITK